MELQPGFYAVLGPTAPYRVFAFLSGPPDDSGMVETTGERIRRLREARRWSQSQLADLLDVSTKSVSNWETGRNDPRSSLGALREVFGRQFDAGEEVSADDPVEQAVRQSELTEDRQYDVIGYYKRRVREQREERAG